MFRYGLTIFLSAFLLFQVQPMIARFILPWFGGTAAVWTTCMMFFQTVLLLGYLYAHLLRTSFRPVYAWVIHVGLLIIAAAIVSVVPPENLKPTGDGNLTTDILKVLAVSIGLPFFALSTTGPLIQAWQSTTHRDQSPYRLYALSNLGSMLALLSYPFLVERFFPLAGQAMVWTIGFYVFVLLCCWSGWQSLKFESWADSGSHLTNEKEPKKNQIAKDSGSGSIGMLSIICWIVLAMGASIVLLATTNLMCQEVASVPFLWILPLVLYLLSFIICFERPALYRRGFFAPLLIVSSIVAIALVHLDVLAGLGLQIVGLATVCFAASMTCHGELERLKPDAKHLTSFYLWVSVGGALGGIFVCVAAPNWFAGFYEFHVGLIVALVVALVAILLSSTKKDQVDSRKVVGWGLAMGIFVALGAVACSLMYFLDPSYHEGVVFRDRNEYGLASVIDEKPYRTFVNGRIDHGVQLLDPTQQQKLAGYYVEASGVGVAFQSYRAQTNENLKVGVIGLGAGAMSNWLESGDEMVFYEINPMVESIALDYFTFLSKCPGECSVVLGDGRVQLQKELKESDSEKYDILVMDAFASDSIPVHLLTQECFDLYFERLKPNGILVAHITNRFIDLRPVLFQDALDRGIEPVLIDLKSDDRETRWVLMTKNEDVLASDFVKNGKSDWPVDLKPMKWTDDFASVAALLNWSAGVDWNAIQEGHKNPKKDESDVSATVSE